MKFRIIVRQTERTTKFERYTKHAQACRIIHNLIEYNDDNLKLIPLDDDVENAIDDTTRPHSLIDYSIYKCNALVGYLDGQHSKKWTFERSNHIPVSISKLREAYRLLKSGLDTIIVEYLKLDPPADDYSCIYFTSMHEIIEHYGTIDKIPRSRYYEILTDIWHRGLPRLISALNDMKS